MNTRPDPLLVLIHGWAGRAKDWDPFVAALPKAYEFFRLTLPGHEEKNFAEDDKNFPSWDELITGLARELLAKERRLVLVGYSLGGRVALALAPLLGERLVGIAALGAGLGSMEPEWRQKRIALDSQRAGELRVNPQKFWTSWYAQPLFQGGRSSLPWDAVGERAGESRTWGIAQALEAFSPGRHGSLEEQARATKSLLYFYGELDSFYRTSAQNLAARSPTVRVKEVRGAAHSLLKEAPEVVARETALWLKDLLDREGD